ncbi:MAG: sulfotransferase [Actinomycetota bacterium]
MSWPHRIEGTAEELLAEARRTTEIDLDDEGALEPLSILLDAYNASARFTAAGAVMKRTYVLRILRNRLRMARDLAAHPEILDIELRPPLLINALPRTGSTKMQKTLAATGDFNFLPYWMCINSASHTGRPHEDVTPRIAEIQAYADWFGTVSPEAKLGHDMSPHEPEEEAYVLMQSLRCRALAGFANADSYVGWVGDQDPALQYRYLDDTMRYLVWQGLADPDRPFLLKCVVNLGMEAEIRSAIPDVRIAMMHRDPVSVVPSAAKLGLVFRKAYSDAVPDLSRSPARFSAQMRTTMRHRGAHPDEAFHDISYEDVRRDARSVLDGIYEFADVEPTAATYANVARWEADNPQHRHGSWTYSAEDFGFTDDDVRTAFADYYDWVEAEGIADWRS